MERGKVKEEKSMKIEKKLVSFNQLEYCINELLPDPTNNIKNVVVKYDNQEIGSLIGFFFAPYEKKQILILQMNSGEKMKIVYYEKTKQVSIEYPEAVSQNVGKGMECLLFQMEINTNKISFAEKLVDVLEFECDEKESSDAEDIPIETGKMMANID